MTIRKKGFTQWSVKAPSTPAANLLPKIDALGTQYHSIGFRGDARDLKTLAMHDGGAFLPRTQSPYQITKYNMDKRWNPFQDNQVRDTMYWREGQADNDLFTVVSVAKNIGIATKFPLLHDPPPEMKSYPQAAKLEFEDSTTKVKSVQHVTATTCFVYLVVADQGYDTEAFQQSGFPEIGVEKIEADKFLAYLDVVRLHFGGSADDGHLAFVQNWHFVQEHKNKLLYECSGQKQTEFGSYMTNNYYLEFFEYNPLKTRRVTKIVECQEDLVPKSAVSKYNRSVK